MSATTAGPALTRTTSERSAGSVPFEPHQAVLFGRRQAVLFGRRGALALDSGAAVGLNSGGALPLDSGAALRLTRRGRLAFLAIGTVLAGMVIVGGGWASADEPRDATAVATHTVVAGETLWSIAAGIATPADDIRVIVDTLVQLNSLPNPGLRAGQQILVPAAS
jgi:hypothetical protein